MTENISLKIVYDNNRDISIINEIIHITDELTIKLFCVKIKGILCITDDVKINLQWFDGSSKFSLNSDFELKKAIKTSKNRLKPLCIYVVCDYKSLTIKSNGYIKQNGERKPSLVNLINTDLLSVNKSLTHHSVLCNNCHVLIIGNRFKCLECIDFDLCSTCFLSNNHDNSHSLLVIRSQILSAPVHKLLSQCQKETRQTLSGNHSNHHSSATVDSITQHTQNNHNNHESTEPIRISSRRYSDFIGPSITKLSF